MLSQVWWLVEFRPTPSPSTDIAARLVTEEHRVAQVSRADFGCPTIGLLIGLVQPSMRPGSHVGEGGAAGTPVTITTHRMG